MAFPRIPRVIFMDQVKSRSGSFSKDATGGRVLAEGAWGQSVRCSVSAAGASDVETHSRENMLVSHVVTSYARLGYIRDQLQWQETGAILTIVGVEPAGDGEGRIWNHYCEERPTK